MELDRYSPEEVERVIYHELGHYYGLEINKSEDICYGTHKVRVWGTVESQYELLGDTIPFIPEDVDPKRKVKFKDLSYYFARTAMGCIFQCYYQNSDINECYNQNRNGSEDIQQRQGQIDRFRLGYDFRDTLNKLEEHFLEKLIEEKLINFLDKIDLASELSLNTESNKYELNLELFWGLMESPKFEKFKSAYLSFVEQIDEALRNYKVDKSK
ncbi:MAG: hypothetical protein NXI00_02885 [Cytophagales bacterium]|nr:hypothetical protein [Cytophagales bacterium]